MTDPKYANLPGIAHDQPDCYETSDLPEADQNREVIEEESEFVERVNINVPDAFSKFKGKTLIGDGVDFSDRLSKGRRIGYYARSGDWELAGAGDKETPLQRYERLKLEFKELIEDLSAIKEGDNNEQSQVVVTHVSTMLNQLESLKLEQLPESETVDLTDPQGIHMRKLLSELQSESVKPSKKDANSKPGEGRVVYSVLARPDLSTAQHSARIARLEQGIHEIQSAITPSNPKSRALLGDRSLLELAREVESKVNMLLPSQLEAADSRISALLTKMDQVKEKAPQHSAEAETKVSELYELLKGSCETTDILPTVVDRLAVVESLHKQALEFSKSKTEYETLQTTLKNDFENTKKLLDKVDDNLNQKMSTLKTTVESLDSKMKTLSSSVSKGKKK